MLGFEKFVYFAAEQVEPYRNVFGAVVAFTLSIAIAVAIAFAFPFHSDSAKQVPGNYAASDSSNGAAERSRTQLRAPRRLAKSAGGMEKVRLLRSSAPTSI